MAILVIADHDNSALNPAVKHTVSAAQALGQEVEVLVAGLNAKGVAEQCASIQRVSKVLLAQSDALAHFLAENIAAQVLQMASRYTHILFPATARGKDVAPRVAALLDSAQLSEVTKVIDANTFERFIYTGNAVETVQSMDVIKVLTVRSSAFMAAPSASQAASIEEIDAVEDTGLTQFVALELLETERPELGTARVVVGGGKAFGSKENLEKYLYPLADKLNAAIGVTRPLTDEGFAPNDWQLGQTGKVVAPELYFAIGISGALQHTSGIKDSKFIVAINDSADAPIFKIADYGLVGDLFDILPKLTEAL